MKGAFGTLRRENALYELQQQENPARQGPWSGSTIPLQLPPIAPSAYQQALDQGSEVPHLTTDTVRFWSDYNHLFYHPRSIVQLNEYELNSSLMPFERWQTGEELFSNLDREHDLLDRDLRPFLEECDQLQALQIFGGIDDAWGGFTARYLERISDELGKGCRWVFGLKDGKQNTRGRQLLQLENLAQSLFSIDSSASVHLPITSLPKSFASYLSLDSSSAWHTSALAVALVESITLPARLRSSENARATFEQMETTLNNDGNRKIVASALSVKDPDQLNDRSESTGQTDTRMTNGNTNSHVENSVQQLDISLFPNMNAALNTGDRRLDRREHMFSKMESLRGSWSSSIEIDESNGASRERFADGPRTIVHQSQLLFPVLPSYPRIFAFNDRPERLATKAAISTSTAVSDQLRELETSARRLIGIDEREALCDGLASMAEEYVEGWTGSDESDDDA